MHPDDDALNEYIDGSADSRDLAEIERHLADCSVCRGVVADLVELKHAASELSGRGIDPPDRVWASVSHAIGRERPRSIRPGWIWLGAAAVLVLAVAAGIRLNRVPAATLGVDAPPTMDAVESELGLAEEHYGKAITQLEQVTAHGDDTIDAATVATLKEQLAIIDHAIVESRSAIRAQPGSEVAQASLIDSFQAKVALLQESVALLNNIRKDKG
jgi:anti-sigma factor RsiW